MDSTKRIGIWMDYAHAHIMEFADPILTTIISSEFTHQKKAHSISKSESLMHHQENHLHNEYFKKIIEIIRMYGEVLLFGPTNAKDELFNLIKAEHKFEKIKIEVLPSDHMTENQQHAFVKMHFGGHKS
jgi:hypothetical protein